MDARSLFKSWLLIALGVLIASNVFAGIRYTDTSALVVAVLLLSLCNVFLKPLLMLFALPFIILTFGLGIWLINALLFMLVGHLVSGFSVDSFGYALAGALVVSLIGGVANLLFGKGRVKVKVNMSTSGPRSGASAGASSAAQAGGQTRKPLRDDDVIDI